MVAELEARVPEADEVLRKWLNLVRGSLSDPIEGLIHDIRAEAAGSERPLSMTYPTERLRCSETR